MKPANSKPLAVEGKHQDLWATRIWRFDVSALRPRFAEWIQWVSALRAVAPTPAGRSNRQGWNSDKVIFQKPEFAELHAVSTRVFRHVLTEMGVTAGQDFQLSAWANVHDTGGFNVSHIHQNCWLSGCFYLQVPDGAGPIVLRDPRPGAMMAPFRGGQSNNFQEVRIRPQAGLLLVFPNWLEHAVEPNESPEPRISIAMNALPVPVNKHP